MLRTLAKTLTDGELSENGMELRVSHPRAPHTKPHPDGGYVMLFRYVAEVAVLPLSDHANPLGHHEYSHQHIGEGRMEAEIIKYSGYREDNDLIMIIEKRGAEGTVPKCWAAGTMVTQNAYGSDFGEILDALKLIDDKGCLVAVPSAGRCEVVKKGSWRCIGGVWRRAKKDIVISEDTVFPNTDDPETEDWAKPYDIQDMLSLLEVHHWDGEDNGRTILEGAAVDGVDPDLTMAEAPDLNGTHYLSQNQTSVGGLVSTDGRSVVVPHDGWYMISHEFVADIGIAAKAGWTDTSGGYTATPTVASWSASPYVRILVNNNPDNETRIRLFFKDSMYKAFQNSGASQAALDALEGTLGSSKKTAIYMKEGDVITYEFSNFVSGVLLGRYSLDITWMGAG